MMIQPLDSNQHLVDAAAQTYMMAQHLANTNRLAENPSAKTLMHIVNKHRKQQYITTFVSKLRRNNVYQDPAIF